MLSINMIRTTLCIIAITLAATVSSVSVTSPGVCISDVECRSTDFCERSFFSQIPRCVPRYPEVIRCNKIGLGECEDGLTCVFDDSIRTDGPTCQPRAVRGAKCRPELTRPCVDDLVCDRNTTTCQPFTDGFAGTPCFLDSHCQQDKGFYCQMLPGVCAPKREEGAECNRASDNYECLGFCLGRSSDDGVCISARKDGEVCTDDRQCENSFFRRFEPGADPLVCNLPKGLIGRCMRKSSLVNRLGARCDPGHDRCNAGRGLSCRPTRNGENVCQHRNSRFGTPFASFCEPRSSLSRCPWRNEKQECRLERLVPGQYRPVGLSPFLRCRRKSERVARGGVCIRDYAACAGGTECRLVPGVRPKAIGLARVPSTRVSFCVHIAKEDEFCGDVNDKFTTQCDEGLRCEKGKCVKAENSEPPFDETETHLGLGALCSDLPCAPGLVCNNTEFDPEMRCILPLTIVGKGQACTDRAVGRRRCEEGLVCALRRDGTNVNRCREPRKAGEYCQIDDQCVNGLACPVLWTGDREQEERRCYDPQKALKIGDKCDPEANASQARCVENERPDEFDPSFKIRDPMRCVRKGDGFACRVVEGLFQFCDEAEDITCDIGLKCGNLGVCVPAREA